MDPLEPLVHDITIARGITHEPFLAVFSDANGAQVDLTGWSVECLAKKRAGGPLILDLLPVILPVGTLLGYDGEVDGPGRVKYAGFTDEETALMKNAGLLFDMVLTTPDGRRLGTFIAGECNIVTIISE